MGARPLVPRGGVVRVFLVSGFTLGPRSPPSEGKAQRAPWAGAFGAPFRALGLRGTVLQATRPSRGLRVCQFVESVSRPGSGSRRWDRLGADVDSRAPVLRSYLRSEGFQPATAHWRFLFFALPVPGGAAEPGLWLFRLGNSGWPGWAA